MGEADADWMHPARPSAEKTGGRDLCRKGIIYIYIYISIYISEYSVDSQWDQRHSRRNECVCLESVMLLN